VLIDELNLDFSDGYSVMTGETGAGKSIILTSLGLIIGKKLDKSIIRFGQDFAEVTAEFALTEEVKRILQENDLEADELLIRRKITVDGKSKAFVNDAQISLKLLAEIGEKLVEIHTQHEQSTLFEPEMQGEVIDRFAKLESEVEELKAAFQKWNEAKRELVEKQRKIAEVKKEEDYLRHVLDELVELNPQAGEEEELADTRRKMMDYEKVAALLRDVEEELTRDKNIETAILNAQKTLMRSGNEDFHQLIENLERASIEISEVFSGLTDIQNSMEHDPEKINQVEERLFAIRGLARKYDCHPDQLADYMAEIEGKLNALQSEEKDIKMLVQEVAQLEAEYMKIANDVSAKRKKAAKELEKKLVAELKPLAMAGTKFEVEFSVQAPSALGIDRVEFLASTNPGTPLSALSKIASGGEISRFMLALKVVLLDVSTAPTVIFDEIDTGTGGSVAASIGERLAKLGKELQVFVVTHLPQVAAQATTHMRVLKEAKGGANLTNVRILEAEERRDELARMLSGAELTDEARAQAIKLMA